MSDEELPEQVADALRRMSAGPAPTPSAELAAVLASGTRRGQRRVARLTTGGASIGVAAKVLLATALAAASVGAVGAAHVLTKQPGSPHRPPAVVSSIAPRSQPRSGPELRPSATVSPWAPAGSDPVGATAGGAPSAPGAGERDTSRPGGTDPAASGGESTPSPSTAGTSIGSSDEPETSPAAAPPPSTSAGPSSGQSATTDGSGD